MNLSVLDIFILSMLHRGAESPYDLGRRGGMSLGASTPSFTRLLKAKLVSKQEGTGKTSRPRYVYRLTAAGKEQARTAWKSYLNDTAVEELDLDSILRIVDIAVYSRGERRKIGTFLRRAAEFRIIMADQAAVASREIPFSKLTYLSMKNRCNAGRLRAEGEVLMRLSELFARSGDPVEGQQSLPV